MSGTNVNIIYIYIRNKFQKELCELTVSVLAPDSLELNEIMEPLRFLLEYLYFHVRGYPALLIRRTNFGLS